MDGSFNVGKPGIGPLGPQKGPGPVQSETDKSISKIGHSSVSPLQQPEGGLRKSLICSDIGKAVLSADSEAANNYAKSCRQMQALRKEGIASLQGQLQTAGMVVTGRALISQASSTIKANQLFKQTSKEELRGLLAQEGRQMPLKLVKQLVQDLQQMNKQRPELLQEGLEGMALQIRKKFI